MKDDNKDEIILIVHGEGLTVAEAVLYNALQSLYGFPRVLLFSSLDNYEYYIAQHHKNSRGFVIVVWDKSMQPQIREFFASYYGGGETLLAIKPEEYGQIPLDLAHDRLVHYGENMQGVVCMSEIVSALGVPDEAHQPVEVVCAHH